MAWSFGILLSSYLPSVDAARVDTSTPTRTASSSPPPYTDVADEEGETLESINQLPSVMGDPESHRRELIKKALELRDSKDKIDEAKRWIQIDEYIRAADRVRSSTFTRCNLAALAHHQGDEVRAAEYYRKEQEQPLKRDATAHQKFIRDICDMHAAVAYERVGELKITAPARSTVWINGEYAGIAPLAAGVFVKPNEEQRVVAELEDRTEIQKSVKVKAGKRTTLELQSPKPQEAKREVPKATDVRVVATEAQTEQKQNKQGGLGRDLRIGGMATVGVGFGVLLGGVIWKAVAKSALSAAKGNDDTLCGTLPTNSRDCAPYYQDIDSADHFIYLSTGILGLGLGGVGLSFLFPDTPPNPGGTKAIGASLPKGLTISGAF